MNNNIDKKNNIQNNDINKTDNNDINSEYYVYLGYNNKTHFFVHIIKNKNYKDKIAKNIYKVLINNEIIIDYCENIMIYQFNNNKYNCNIVCIEHKNKNIKDKYNKKNLEEYFIKLKNKVNNLINIVEYNYENKKYIYHTIDDAKIMEIIINSDSNIKINKIKLITISTPVL